VTEGRREAVWVAIAAATSLLAGLIAVQVWKESLSIPFTYFGDGNFYTAIVKGVVDHGWFLTNPDLGWPLGQTLHDFPMGGDNGAFALIALMGLFTSDAAVVVNLFFLAGFALVGTTAYLVLRRLEISRPSSVVASTVFAILPYHVYRNEFHLTLGLYVAIPLVVLLLVRVAQNTPLLTRRDRRRTTLIVLACVVIGSTGIGYYALFGIALLALVGPAAALVHRSWRPLASAASVGAIIAAVLAINLAPSVVYRLDHGRNDAIVHRGPQETETFSTNLWRLVVGPADHRFPPLRHLAQGYQNSTSLPATGEGAGYLGAIAAIGFALLLAVMLVRLLGGRGTLLDRLAPFGAIAGIAFLIGTTDGLATIFAYVVTPMLHGAGRISLVIAFTSLLAVAVVLDLAFGRLLRRGLAGALAVGAACAALIGFALYDQALLPYTAGDPARTAAWRNDAAFVDRIEAALPAGAAVFELPIVRFIEYGASPGKLDAYAMARPYLHSHDLRWSYGAMRGRPADWQYALRRAAPRTVLPALAAVGFAGLYVDRGGYAAPDRLRRTLVRLTGTRPLVSADGRLEFYDLRPYARRLEARRSAAELARLRARVLSGRAS
jgi:phosphoglycerol transferase